MVGPSAEEPARAVGGAESQGQLLERQGCDGRGVLGAGQCGDGWRGMTSNDWEQRCKEAHRTLTRSFFFL